MITTLNHNKIGILTFHKSINYGSVLQTWALQNILHLFGGDIYIIDYEPHSYKDIYGIFRKVKSCNDFLYNLKRLPIAYIIKKQNELFATFRKKYLRLTEQTFYRVSDLEKSNLKYNAIVCGSDQVWNVHAHDCDDIFFLPFEFKGKKIAYAISINNTNFKEKRCDEVLKKNILDFSAISCRENSGAKKISDFIGCEGVFTALDPTLLLEKSQYDGICSERIIEKDYIFLYNVWGSVDAFPFAKILSKIYHKPVYTILTKRNVKSIVRMEANGIHVLKFKAAPEDFLSLVKYADFIVSDSFHGTAFSLIFEREFVSVNQKIGKGNGFCLKNDERIVHILSVFGLESRYISIFDSDKLYNLEPIDYDIVTLKRMKLSNESVQWLLSALV